MNERTFVKSIENKFSDTNYVSSEKPKRNIFLFDTFPYISWLFGITSSLHNFSLTVVIATDIKNEVIEYKVC